MDKYTVLKQYFGHSSFRGGQEEMIDALLNGRDVFGIMPTGGGKSICYQVPAILMDGITFVISPLISLMKDQVMALKNAGVKAAFINSTLSPEQISIVYDRMCKGEYKIVYVAPERLSGDGFLFFAQQLNISMIAVDEAHCISMWGQDFRPSYRQIVSFIEKLPQRPALAAFTATATTQVRDDIEQILKLRSPLCLVTGFDRPNLNFEVLKPKNKAKTLSSLLHEHHGKSGIIYCATRAAVEQLCGDLSVEGRSVTRYHAGLTDMERRQNQDDFIYDRRAVMIATNAFGMGIDKSNVSFIIHYNMPKSLEAYYQEAGRAGRDGEKADCILLFSSGDISTAKYFIQNSGESEDLGEEERRLVTEQDYKRLDAIIGYCKTRSCLRGYILGYFAQEHTANCGNCGNCSGEYIEKDITNEAQMILSCVKRVKDRLGYSVGSMLIVRTLCASAEKRVIELGLDKLSTYGLMKNVSRQAVKEYLDCLESLGYLYTDPVYGGIELTKISGDVLFNNEKVKIKEQLQLKKVSAPPDKKAVYTDADTDIDLYEVLKTLRLKLAGQEGVPAYVIFSNAVLANIVRKMPGTLPEFLSVSGVGEFKASRYGKIFLDAIAEYKKDRG